MAKITIKIADKIAVAMAADMYQLRIKYLNGKIEEALTEFAVENIPLSILKLARTYPDYVPTTRYVVVEGTVDGKDVRVYNSINIDIPCKPTFTMTDENRLRALVEMQDKRNELISARTNARHSICSKVYKCITTKRLETEFPEAYKTMLEIEKAENQVTK